MKIRTEAVLGTLTLLLGVSVVIAGWKLGVSLSAEGAGLFPCVVGVSLVLCGLVQIAAAPSTRADGQDLAAISWVMVAKTFGWLVAYVLLVDFLGYFAATSVFLLVQMWMLGARGWLKLAAMALGTALAFTFVFEIWMQMPLPEGLLGGWRL